MQLGRECIFEKLYLNTILMDKKIMEWSLYEAPSLKSLDIMSEGVLCASYGEAGAAGKNLDVENEWNL